MINRFYKPFWTKAIPDIGLTTMPGTINDYINLWDCSPGGKHADFRAIGDSITEQAVQSLSPISKPKKQVRITNQ
jgi:hypothetical protein